QAISNADLSRAISNINSRRKNTGTAQIHLDKETRRQMAVKSVENAFEKYRLQFGLSDIRLDNKQLNIVDNALSEMGILYSLSHIPCYKNGDKWPQSDDVCTLGSFLWFLTSEICGYMESADIGLSDRDIMELNSNIKSAMLGRLIENCIAVHFVKELEKSCELPVNAKSYANGRYIVNRKCTKMHMYKYNNNIEEDGKSVTAEIDLILSTEDSIRLIEIKKSTAANIRQTRWLNNETVIDEIVQKIATGKPVEKYVYYMGKPCEADGIHYRNIPTELLKDLDA
ncbi:MAG: hypothetical protein NC548_56355, partial [Lachnospiraceae bacterium]|nr:hypothetical protein [Lachnospiraceae bacterium]